MRENEAMQKTSLHRETSRFLDAWLRVRQLIQAANFNRFQKAGLSATQFMTLNLLPASGKGLTLSVLAKQMNLGMATVARTIDSLEARGMLTRTKSASDRRATHITLTQEGKTLQNAASREFHNQMANLFRSMDPKQRTGLIEGLESLIQASTRPSQTMVIHEADADPQGKHSSPRSRRQ